MPVITRAQRRARDTHDCRVRGCGQCQPDRRAEEEEEEATCSICFEPIDEDRSLSCPRGHSFDFECIKKMVETRTRRTPQCSGFIWRCPLCRVKSRLGFLHVLMLIQDSVSGITDHFHCGTCALGWQHGSVRGVEEDDDEALQEGQEQVTGTTQTGTGALRVPAA